MELNIQGINEETNLIVEKIKNEMKEKEWFNIVDLETGLLVKL